MAGLGCCGRPQGPPALGLAAVPPSTGLGARVRVPRLRPTASRGGHVEPGIGSSCSPAPWGRVQVGTGMQSCSSPPSPLADGASTQRVLLSSSLSVVAVSFSGPHRGRLCWLACAVRRAVSIQGEGWGREAEDGIPRAGSSKAHSALACLSLLGLPGDHGDPGLGPHKPLFWGS